VQKWKIVLDFSHSPTQGNVTAPDDIGVGRIRETMMRRLFPRTQNWPLAASKFFSDGRVSRKIPDRRTSDPTRLPEGVRTSTPP